MERRWLSALEVTDLRNFSRGVLEPGEGINLLIGANGSGKTSLLEAIHLLTVGRSFLTSQASAYVRHGAVKTTVFGRARIGSAQRRIGVEKDLHGATELRLDGTRVQGFAAIAELLPVVLITPESHTLIGGGPSERRALLDWGLFHVEHDYLTLWRRYQRFLRQRNAALATGAGLRQWSEGLAESGEALSERRAAYVGGLAPYLAATLRELAPELGPLSMDYLAGWAAELDLLTALTQAEERDLRDGYTHVGPHRAELRLRLEGKRAAEVLSRGQEKLVLSGLRVAQLLHLRAVTDKGAVVLVDDLPAELDLPHRRALLRLLASLQVQVFVTTTEAEAVPLPAEYPTKVFHVEHGSVRAVV